MKLTILKLEKYRLPAKQDFVDICQLVDQAVGVLPGLVNLIFCDDKTIRQLNHDYRKKDKVTDVLTFTYNNNPKTTLESELIGEVIVSIPQTKRQAKEYRVSFESELYKLVIHGLVHLRGYDHEKDDEYRVMKLLEDKIMKNLIESKKN